MSAQRLKDREMEAFEQDERTLADLLTDQVCGLSDRLEKKRRNVLHPAAFGS